jgi:hypothetical protein
MKNALLSLLAAGLLVAPRLGVAQDDMSGNNAQDTTIILESSTEPIDLDQPMDSTTEEVVPLSATGTELTTNQAGTEASVSELQRILNLPTFATIKEYQEDLTNPRSIFPSASAEISEIFGSDPEFIYFPEGVDPMIIPWVRERIVAEELFAEAGIARANRDFDKAIATLRELREKYPSTEPGQKAAAELARVMEEREAAMRPTRNPTPQREEFPAVPAAPADPVLPAWVAQNTSGVILGTRPVVVVGNDFLTEGDAVPRFASVKVKSIRESEVVYTYQDKEFPVEVVGSF